MLYSIRPRSIIYLFSGGKDSALALALTRDAVREYAEEHRARVYIVHISLPGNTHPLNVFAAAAVMLWHKQHYGFEPVFLARDRVFQPYVIKYGLMTGKFRWCYQEFKNKVITEFERRLPRPVLEITGMKPSDSKHRADLIKSEFQRVTRKHNGFSFWAWHPLINFTGNPLDELRKYDEFKPIVTLYELFGDSLNCVVCPYRSKDKLMKMHEHEDLGIINDFLRTATRSPRWHRMFSFTRQQQLHLENPQAATRG